MNVRTAVLRGSGMFLKRMPENVAKSSEKAISVLTNGDLR